MELESTNLIREFVRGPVFPWVFGFFFIALFTAGMLFVSNDAGKIHRALDSFWLEANATNDINKLCDINKRLIAYAKAKCWHRHFGNHAREVNEFICGKIQGLKGT